MRGSTLKRRRPCSPVRIPRPNGPNAATAGALGHPRLKQEQELGSGCCHAHAVVGGARLRTQLWTEQLPYVTV